MLRLEVATQVSAIIRVIRCCQFFCLLLLFAIQVGCSCNNSRLTSNSSDSKIGRVLEKEFGQPMNQGSRLATALDMQNSPSFPVFEAVDSNDILLQLGFSGCTFFYPRYPDTNLLVRFSPDGSYLGFHRWAIEDDLWRSSGREYASELDEQEGDIESRGHFVTSYFGDRRAYRIVLRNDTVTD